MSRPTWPRSWRRRWSLAASSDGFYSEDLFRRTAAAMPDGRVVLFPGKNHMYVAGLGPASRRRAGLLARLLQRSLESAPASGAQPHHRFACHRPTGAVSSRAW